MERITRHSSPAVRGDRLTDRELPRADVGDRRAPPPDAGRSPSIRRRIDPALVREGLARLGRVVGR